VPKGKPWTREEEKTLIQLVNSGKSVEVIAEALKKSEGAIFMKMRRLGLEVVIVSENQEVTTTSQSSQPLPVELPTVEEALRRLNAALVALEQPGIDRKEIMRLKSVIQGLKMYKDYFADYMHYRKIEIEVVKLRKEFEEQNSKVKDSKAKDLSASRVRP
jgi:hypothetical protein